ncbi:hypothetical protein [Microvirga massiliensis]|uniref:hypothetical protein n=1 Tax=Microvirga massiliensis TaxID=1033741 RepID=UPI00062B8B0C|nr:hypothetical protein [Microvirga massiliensis]
MIASARHGAGLDGRRGQCVPESRIKLNSAFRSKDIVDSQVARFVEEGRIAEVAAYCETDVVSTSRIQLADELFRGALTPDQFRASEESLFEYVG